MKRHPAHQDAAYHLSLFEEVSYNKLYYNYLNKETGATG